MYEACLHEIETNIAIIIVKPKLKVKTSFFFIQILLCNPAIRREIDEPHNRTDSVMSDFCDAQFFRMHPIFSTHPKALQFILYYDEIDVANPLGAKAGDHKLGNVFSSLFLVIEVFLLHVGVLQGNIRPVFRSSMKCIQLLAVAKNHDIRRFGFINEPGKV